MIAPKARLFLFDVRVTLLAVLAVCAATIACDRATLLAPTNSRITLTASNRVLPTGGSTTLTATVLENSGSPVPNGTTVRFIASLGRVEPVEAQTSNGVATATFLAGNDSGIAEVQAISGLATGTTTTSGTGNTATTSAANVVTITIGAAAVETVTLRANPGSVGPFGGSVTVTALVVGVGGRTLPGIPVSFSASQGQFSSATAVTNELGEASTSLTTDRETTVRATAGAKTSEALTVGVRPGPSITLTCAVGATQNCATVTIGQSVTFTVTPGANTSRIREVILDFGENDVPAVNLGAVSGPTTVGHTYGTAGSFTARARAVDVGGDEVAATQFVQVRGPLSLTVTAEIVSGRRVRANARVEGVGNASVVQYEYTFQGGQPNVITTNSSAEFTYDSAGTKTVTVRVTLTDGRVATASDTVNIPT